MLLRILFRLNFEFRIVILPPFCTGNKPRVKRIGFIVRVLFLATSVDVTNGT